MSLPRLPVTIALLATLAGVGGAQTVRGRVLEAKSGAPVVAAIVVLVDSAGQRRTGAFSDDSGRFILDAPSPGRYRVRVERVGLRPELSPPVAVPAGQTVERDFRLSPTDHPLDAVVVRRNVSCRSLGEADRQTVQVWEEARRGLTATAITQDQRLVRTVVSRWERILDPQSLRVREELSRRSSESVGSPFVSRSAEELAERGYVRADSGEFDYYGIDAHVLLSDAFVAEHCFRIVRGESGDRIGLAFEPLPGRDRTDIAGVLWIDRSSGELRELDFRYTRLPWRIPTRNLGGRVEFRRLPSGLVIIERWHLRMPLIARVARPNAEVFGAYGSNRTEEVLEAIEEEGGEVVRITGEGALPPNRATVAGAVFDSLRMAPLAGGRVFLSGTAYAATTTEDGRFTLEGVPEGTYTLSVLHPVLDSLGIAGPTTELALVRGRRVDVDLALPSADGVVAGLCADTLRGRNRRLVTGRIRSADGMPAGEADVLVEWTRWRTDAAGRRVLVSGSGRRIETKTDRSGFYRVCGVPRDELVTVRARDAFGRTSSGRLEAADAPLARLDLELGRGGAGH